jgi:hypothetical protein
MVTEEKRIEEVSFSAAQSGDLDLFLLLEDDSLHVSMTDEANHVLALTKLVCQEHTSSHDFLQESMHAEPLLRLKYNSVSVGIGNQTFSLVPKRLFDEQAAPSVYHHLLGPHGDGFHLVDEFQTDEFVSVFFVEKHLHESITSLFPGAGIHHVSSTLIPVFQNLARQNQETALYGCVSGEVLYLSFFKAGELQFFNRFYFRSARDFLYFVLLVYRQFSLKPDQTPLYLGGSLLSDSSIYNLLYRYVRHIRFLEPPEGVTLQSLLSKEPRHLYFGSLSLKACGS